jgi:hypothetical protein
MARCRVAALSQEGAMKDAIWIIGGTIIFLGLLLTFVYGLSSMLGLPAIIIAAVIWYGFSRR